MTEWTLIATLFAALVAGIVGFVSGMFGVGGGFLLVPILSAILGVPMTTAVGSTACFILGPATVALLARKPRMGFIELPLILGGGLFAGVVIGTRLLQALNSSADLTIFGRDVAAVDFSVLVCYLILMLGIAAISLRDALKPRPLQSVPRRGLLASVQLPPVANIPDMRPSHHSIPMLVFTGMVVGFLSGFLGMSGGLVLIPSAIFLLGLRAQDATTITIVIVFLVSLQSTVVHAGHGHVQRSLVVALLVGGTIGAAMGAQVGMKLKGRQLRLGFGLLVLLSAGIVAARLWQLWSTNSP